MYIIYCKKFREKLKGCPFQKRAWNLLFTSETDIFQFSGSNFEKSELSIYTSVLAGVLLFLNLNESIIYSKNFKEKHKYLLGHIYHVIFML